MPLAPEYRDTLRQHNLINEWTRKYPQHSHEITAALDRLAENPNVNTIDQGLLGIDHLADAICNGIKIFVSYKLGHGDAAQALLEPFLLFGNGRILFDRDHGFPFLCEQAGTQGKEYMNEIRSTLDQTHWFFLLLPDAIIDRSWTMFEAGFFRRAMRPGDRLFCILHPTITPAGPLEGFERTSADTEKILQLFKSLLCTKGAVPGMDIINSALTDAHLKTFANNLVEKIRPSYKLVRRFYVNYVDLKLDQDKPIRNKTDLLATQATAGLNLDRMFLAGAELEKPTQDETDAEAGSRDGITFGEILGGDARGPEQDEWLDDLAKTIEAVFDGREPESVEAVFQAADARQYRPVLHTVRRYKHNDALVAAHVAFQEVLTGPLPRAPRELDALATALRLGYRFRWEILEEFRNIANRQEVRRMHRILRRMERESRQRNLDQPRTMTPNEFNDLPLVQAFEGDDRESIIKIYLEWQRYRSRERNGLLDLAFEAEDPNRVAACLAPMTVLNSQFMRIGARRYAELVESHWG